MLGTLKLVDSVRKVIDECRNNANEVFQDIIKKMLGFVRHNQGTTQM